VVGVRYGGIRGLVVVIGVCMCLAITPGVYGAEPRLDIEKLGAVCVPLPEHVAHSLLRHSKSRSRTINGGSVVKVVHWLGRGVWHYSVARRRATCLWIGLSKINSVRRRRIDIRIIKSFPSRSSINKHINSSLLFACLSNTELIID
jgi:hypothetical protein